MMQPGALSIRIRPATLQDLDVLTSIDTQCFSAEIAYPRNEIASLLRSPAVLTLAAEHSKEIVGFASLRFSRYLLSSSSQRRLSDSQVRSELITIDVLPEFRRGRVGRLLYQTLEDWFRDHGGKSIELHVAVDNVAAIAFYEQLDYCVIGRVARYYLRAVDAWHMEKNLLE